MKKKDQILLENAYEQVASGSQYYVYDVMVSGMASEVTMVTDTYTVPAMSIKDAQTKALNKFVKSAEEVDEFLRLVPAKSSDLGIVETGEESMLIVSKNKLSQDQIDDVVYGSDHEYGDNDEFIDNLKSDTRDIPRDIPDAEDIQDKNPMRGSWGKGEY